MMIKNTALVTVLVISSFIKLYAQESDEKAILALMRQETEVWNKGDIEGYVSLYAPVDSVRMFYSGGTLYGRDAILKFYQKYWPKEKMGQLSFSDIKLERLSEKYYFTSGAFHVVQTDGKKINGRFSGLVIKIDGKWYLYTDHSG